MSPFWAFSWIWIPIVAILAGTIKEWLKFKEKQRELGTSAKELEDAVAVLRKELHTAAEREEALVARIQNLEAIVTSEMWDEVHGSAPVEPEVPVSGARPTLPEEEPDAERVERIARRLRV